MWSHQCRVPGDNPFRNPTGDTLSDSSEDAISHLGHVGALLAHVQLSIDRHPQVLFYWAAFQIPCPKPIALCGAVVTQMQGPALSLVVIMWLVSAHQSSLSYADPSYPPSEQQSCPFSCPLQAS